MLEHPQVLQYSSRDHAHQGFIGRKMHLTAGYYKSRLGELFNQGPASRLHSLTSPLWHCCHIHYDKEHRDIIQVQCALKH